MKPWMISWWGYVAFLLTGHASITVWQLWIKKWKVPATNGGKRWWKKKWKLLFSWIPIFCCVHKISEYSDFQTKYLFAPYRYGMCTAHPKLTCTEWKVLNVESLFCSKIQINLDYEIEIDQWRWWLVNGDGWWKQEKVTTMTTEARADAFLLRQWGEDKEETTNVRSGSKSSKLSTN